MPWALQILEIEDGKVGALNYFLTAMDPEGLFPAFDLPNPLTRRLATTRTGAKSANPARYNLFTAKVARDVSCYSQCWK